MLRRRKILLLILIVFAFAVIGLTIIGSVSERPEGNVVPRLVPQNIPETIRIHSIDSPEFRGKLAQWIYDRSQRISKRTARDIVDEVFKYKHPVFLLAIMGPETGGTYLPTSKGPTGDYGLGQVVPAQHKELMAKLGVKDARDLYDIDTNIKAMSIIFEEMLARAKGDPVQTMKFYVGAHKTKYQADLFVNFASMMLLMES